MNEAIMGGLTNLIGGAERLGALSAAAVWAFFTLILIGYIALDMKAKKRASELAWESRLKEAEADILMANAVNKLADEVRYKIKAAGAGGMDV